MADYEKWLVIARQSFDTADLAKNSGDVRSATSRYCYAAYQAVTALLLYRGLTPPALREAWAHDETPEIIVSDLSPVIKSRDARNDMRDRLVSLYRLRVIADYKVSRRIDDEDMNQARKDAGFLLHCVEDILPKEKQP